MDKTDDKQKPAGKAENPATDTAAPPAPQMGQGPAGPSPYYREDGSHIDSPPISARTVRIRITQPGVAIHHGRAGVGHETHVTPEEARRLVDDQGVAIVVPGL